MSAKRGAIIVALIVLAVFTAIAGARRQSTTQNVNPGLTPPDPSTSGPPPRGGPRPSQEMLSACAGKADNASCKVNAPSGETVNGSCRRGPRGEAPACLPANVPGAQDGPGGMGFGPMGGGMGRSFKAGETLPGTQVLNSGILCGYKIATTNPDVQLSSNAQWSCTGNERTLTANGIPNHPVREFPNPGNPNRIAAQRVSFSTSLTPVLRKDGAVPLKIPGFALNGVKFDPGTAQSCTEGCGNQGRDPGGPWRIEALNQSYFQFGVDENNAHVQLGGAYHYHGVPTG